MTLQHCLVETIREMPPDKELKLVIKETIGQKKRDSVLASIYRAVRKTNVNYSKYKNEITIRRERSF